MSLLAVGNTKVAPPPHIKPEAFPGPNTVTTCISPKPVELTLPVGSAEKSGCVTIGKTGLAVKTRLSPTGIGKAG